MKMIIRLLLLGIGFLGGVYVGIHFPQQAARIDQARADQQARVQPQIDAAVAKAKIELLNRFLKTAPTAGSSGAPGSSFLGGGPPSAIDVGQLQSELQQEQQKLAVAQSQLK